MKVLHKQPIPPAKRDLYFLGYDSPGSPSEGKYLLQRQGIIELCHDHGSENDDSFTINNGNKEPGKGFGHICVTVDHIQAACKRLEDAGYKFKKKLEDGKMNYVAFVYDPDEYWVELVSFNPVTETENITTTDLETYRMNHTMIRVKDINKSLQWYRDILGMSLTRTLEMPDLSFDLYFMGYWPAGDHTGDKLQHPNHKREGLLELTYNYGSEKDADLQYHNGNQPPHLGFGHIGITVDNIEAACQRFDSLGVVWQKKLGVEPAANLAFMLDPDGYHVEVIQNDAS